MSRGFSERPLILWDIDHTLVDIGSISREIYATAFLAVTGKPLRALPDMTGRTERAILVETLALNGVTEAEEHLDSFYDALGGAAEMLREKMRSEGRRLPGSREALSALAATGAVQSVVTGNVKSIAITKLEAFGLAEHIDLDIGGYGSDHSARSALVRLARRRAERKYGEPLDGKNVIVIGDTPHDVLGAHEAGALAVGVATGDSSIAQLIEAGADAVLADLSDTESVMSMVLAEVTHG